MFNVKQHLSKKDIKVGKFETILSQEEERKKWKLSGDLLVGCPNPTQDRQHFRIPDENYMSTFQFADFAPDKIQFQITSEISQGLWTKTSNFDGIAVGGSSNGNTYHPPTGQLWSPYFCIFIENKYDMIKSWNMRQDHKLLKCKYWTDNQLFW